MTPPRPQGPAGNPAPPGGFTARFTPGGPAFAVAADQTLLHAAALAGVELPSSCRNGTCRTCICKLVSGQVAYVIEWPGLLPEEKADGWILPCVARPRSDVVLSWTGSRQALPVV